MSNDGIHLPFGELIAVLQAEGFTIKPDDYVELLKVVEKFGADGAKKIEVQNRSASMYNGRRAAQVLQNL